MKLSWLSRVMGNSLQQAEMKLLTTQISALTLRQNVIWEEATTWSPEEAKEKSPGKLIALHGLNFSLQLAIARQDSLERKLERKLERQKDRFWNLAGNAFWFLMGRFFPV